MVVFEYTKKCTNISTFGRRSSIFHKFAAISYRSPNEYKDRVKLFVFLTFRTQFTHYFSSANCIGRVCYLYFKDGASAHSGFGNTELILLYRFPQVTVYKPCLRTPDANTKVSKPV
jgi:hypothetical protein